MDSKVVVLAMLLLTVLFAGCVGDADDGDAVNTDSTENTDTTDGPGSEIDEGLTKDSVVNAPEWKVGDYFGHHIFFGSEDAQGTHIDTVVVDAGSSYTLVSDQEETAKWEAAWDFPMLGSIDAQSLDTTAFGSDWNLYDFPLQDGKTWTSTFNPLFSGERELTMTATFDDAIPTVGQGIKPGFTIQGVNSDGELELLTDFIPEIGWYSELTYFDPMTEDADDFIIRIWAMGQGSDWEGTTVTATADEKVNFNGCFAPLNQDGTPNQQCMAVGVISDFSISEEADELYGGYFLLAIAGHSRLDVVELGDQPFSHDRSVMSDSMDSVEAVFDFYEIEDPTPGEWTSKWDGEGLVAVGYSQLWEIQFTATPFPAA